MGTSKPTAYGVEFNDSLGETHKAFLKGGDHDEIILSVGALGSPQLLMLSGIDIADNILNALFIPFPVVIEQSLIHVGITPFGSYIQSTGGSNFITANKSSYLGFTPKVGGFMLEKIDGPKSKGALKIKNPNPSDNPSMSFNYFTEPEDLEKCVKGLETILERSKGKLLTLNTKPILSLTPTPVNPDHQPAIHKGTIHQGSQFQTVTQKRETLLIQTPVMTKEVHSGKESTVEIIKKGHYQEECYKIVRYPVGHPLHGKYQPPKVIRPTQDNRLPRIVNMTIGQDNSRPQASSIP
nr:protein HOTHEAD-like [Tanacetum cinerariifolium]